MEEKMQKIDDVLLKKLELNILENVAEFCDKNNLRYYLCGGTLLGAIRHKGYIPWDDDMDIAMPREDYGRFQQLYNGYSNRYSVNSIENNKQWHMPFARVEDLNTVLYEHTLKPKYKKCHVFIDVFPIDGIPNNHLSEKFFMLKQKFLGILVNASSFCFNPSKHYSDSKNNNVMFRNNIRTFFKYLAIVLFSWVNTQNIIKAMNKNAQNYKMIDSKDVGLTVFVWNWQFEKSSFESFSKRKKFKFENKEFWGPAGFDEYLTRTYGDYKTPPPPQNQVSHHSYDAYLIK